MRHLKILIWLIVMKWFNRNSIFNRNNFQELMEELFADNEVQVDGTGCLYRCIPFLVEVAALHPGK